MQTACLHSSWTEPQLYTSLRELTTAGTDMQLYVLRAQGIARVDDEKAEQFYHAFIDGMAYVARRFGTTVKGIEFSTDKGVNYDGWHHIIRLGADIPQAGVKALEDASVFLEPKAAPHALKPLAYAFALRVEEAFHAHQNRTKPKALKASLDLQREKGIHNTHPDYNKLPHEKEAMRIVREALRDAGFIHTRGRAI